MNAMRDGKTQGEREAGFALILAILSLTLLTFLGLTLAVTTSTELTIATNYRWSQQALYNAEAGLELGKRYLRNVASWNAVLPLSRSLADMAVAPAVFCAGGPPGPAGEPSRNCELWQCDTNRNQGYGIVLGALDPTLGSPFQNVSSVLDPNLSLSGNFTLWVRRRTQPDPATGAPVDNPEADMLILTSEGTAPLQGAGGGAFAISNRAVRVLEMTLQRIDPADCENRGGQIGSGPTGSGFDQCDPVRAEGILGGATEINPSIQ